MTSSSLAGVDRSKRGRHQRERVKIKSDHPNAKKQKYDKAESRWAFLFISPFYLIFLIFGLAPIIFSVAVSFFNWNPLEDTHPYVGLQNFKDLVVDPIFWISVRNTFSIWFFSTIPQMFMAMGIASILRSPKLRGRVFWQTMLLLPNITSAIAIAVVFGQMFGRDFGIINLLLSHINRGPVDWIENTLPSHIAIATMITWRWVGYNSLIFLASMNAISKDLYESADLDGASRFQQFRYVTLPQLKNTITFMVIVGTIGGLQVFAEPATLGGSYDGGTSNQFSTLTLYLFKQVAVNGTYGYAAAIGIGITVLVVIISAINFFITRRISGEGSK